MIGEHELKDRRYRGLTTEQRRAARRERLLEAGLEQFATLGYAGTTIEGLCAAASLNARYFYEHFRNREELLGAIFVRHLEAIRAHVRAALALAPADERVRAGLSAFLEVTLADRRRARIDYVEVVGVSAELEGLRRARKREYAKLVMAETRRTREPAPDPWLVAVALVGALEGLVTDWLAGERSVEPEAVIETMLVTFGPVIGLANR